jgi:CRP-like cAMP-binding protein
MDTLNNKNYQPLLDFDEVMPILNQIAIFGALDENELKILFQKLLLVRYNKGEMICELGAPAKYIYIIKQGKVKLFIEEDNTSFELLEFGVGKCFGETSLIGIQPHSANIIAEEDTELLVLSGKTLHDLYKTDLQLFSKIILNIARETCRRLNQADNVLLHYVLDEKHKGKIL